MTSEVKMREAFEQAMAREGYEIPPARYRDGSYRSAEYAAGWAMWQAARVEARAFTKEQRQDLLSAALYISASDDDSAVLTSEDAERIVELLCRLSGYEHLLEEVPGSLAAASMSPDLASIPTNPNRTT